MNTSEAFPSKITFHYQAPTDSRPREESESDPIEISDRIAAPPIAVGDFITYLGGYSGKEMCYRKVVSKHFFFADSRYTLQVGVTDLSDEEKKMLSKY